MMYIVVETSITYGKIYVLAHYNGHELYNNGHDACTFEEGDDVHLLKCPISQGLHYYVKEMKISSLLPKASFTGHSLVQGAVTTLF